MTSPGAAPPGTVLNVAATCVADEVLGPGRRAVVWVQGCPFDCRGCVAPEWIPDRPARLVEPEPLAAELLADPGVSGLTFSGGEPMAQAAALARLAESVRRERDVSIVCFTGYRLERLVGADARALLGHVDVLIDGLYTQALDDGRGLRGSTNQRVHHLTPRLADSGYDFEHRPRTAEVRITGGELLLIGVPPRGLLEAVDGIGAGRADRPSA